MGAMMLKMSFASSIYISEGYKISNFFFGYCQLTRKGIPKSFMAKTWIQNKFSN